MVYITIVGSGNVARRLCHAFRNARIPINQILSSSTTGKKLAEDFNSQIISSPNEITDGSIVLLCIKDDSLKKSYLEKFKGNYLLCHTAGSVSIEVFGDRKKAGIFYPLQTLSADREIDFANIPICLEANNLKDLSILKILAKNISKDVRVINSEQRLQIHLAAVFVSNFANHLYKIAEDILKEKDISFDILKPLIKESARKIQILSPEKAQTGPALRKDKNVISKHLKLLDKHKEFQKIYKIISNSIIETYKA
ncbi:MAG: hypothetical protein AUJ98_01855 [Bacteroidetes bacterium CG2_30_33_31]|nr:MAG: hypothetical protein AUJ98_01855 [Bacteroidetes bacterium CG2_30_33_31]